MTSMEKHRRLEQILRSQEPGSKIIVFCSTKKMCDQLARNINRQFGAASIHGDKSQSERDMVLNEFRTGKSPILVATDVAARGLDIKDIRYNCGFSLGSILYIRLITPCWHFFKEFVLGILKSIFFALVIMTKLSIWVPLIFCSVNLHSRHSPAVDGHSK